MDDQAEFLVDVGMKNLPLPIKVASRREPEGQLTVAEISINARIMHTFEARWIDTFIRIAHEHRGRIGTATLRTNIADYLRELHANSVRVGFDYPFFVEKETPVSKEQCLVRCMCRYSAKASTVRETAKVVQQVEVPCLTTYPGSNAEDPWGLFAQLSVVTIEVEPVEECYPEDLIAIVDRHALAPVYSYLTEEDQHDIIVRAHTDQRSSVAVVGDIKRELAADRGIGHYSVTCSNYGMLHSYSTVIGTEKSSWVPESGFEQEV